MYAVCKLSLKRPIDYKITEREIPILKQLKLQL